jgi:hypothetical protein
MTLSSSHAGKGEGTAPDGAADSSAVMAGWRRSPVPADYTSTTTIWGGVTWYVPTPPAPVPGAIMKSSKLPDNRDQNLDDEPDALC